MIQDYLYLNQYARASALAAYKAPSMSDCAVSASIVADIQKEMTLHLSYCKEFGLSQEDLQSQQEDQACTAYTRYVLDVGMQQDWFALQVALAPCLLGYGEIANNILMDESSVTKEHGNKYWRWVETYTGEDFQAAFRKGAELLEVHAKDLSVKRVDKIIEIFAHATKVSTSTLRRISVADNSSRWKSDSGTWHWLKSTKLNLHPATVTTTAR